MKELERQLAKIEAERATASGGDIAGRLRAARHQPYAPTHTQAELGQLAERDDLTGRVARGLLRLGERFRLPDSTPREMPPLDPEATMIAVNGALTHSPYEWVLWAFPWNEPGTDLEGLHGPRTWQREELVKLGNRLAANRLVGSWAAVQLAISSGNGPGKSAFASWLVLWALSTHEDTRAVVTASSENQLRSKTAPELARWFNLLICRSWFDSTVTGIYSVV